MATNVHHQSDVIFITFNQDASSLAVGTVRGYSLYQLDKIEQLHKLYDSTSTNGSLLEVSVIERLFSSCLVTLVSQKSPRKLRVCHFQKGNEICSHSYGNTILRVSLNRKRLVVCLEESLFIHNVRDMKVLHIIRDTPPNPQGLCCLSPDEKSYLAYPGSSHNGEVQIYDAAEMVALQVILAHDGCLAAMNFNMDGTKLATASEKGTVIRVFAIPAGDKLFEFRRGMKRTATIFSLAFSPDSLYLAASSNTETVHIFKLEHQKERRDSAVDYNIPPTPTSTPASSVGGPGHGWLEYMSKTAAAYLPTQVSDMLQQDRAFATAHLPQAGVKNVCALAVVDRSARLLVASYDGYYYVYNYDIQNGGECALYNQFKLDDCQVVEPLVAGGVGSSPAHGDATTSARIVQPAEPRPQQQMNPTRPAPSHALGEPSSNEPTDAGRLYLLASSKQPQPTARRSNASAVPKADTVPSSSINRRDVEVARNELDDFDDVLGGLADVKVTTGRLKLDDSQEFPPMSHMAE